MSTMSAPLYRRRLWLGGGLLAATLAASPLLVFGATWLACGGSFGGGCGDASLFFLMFGALPAFIAALGFIGWTIVRRARALDLPTAYAVLACLLLIGCLRSIPVTVAAIGMGHFGWLVAAPAVLTILVAASLFWIPDAGDRGSLTPALGYALVAIGVLQVARLAEAILYPLMIVPGGIELQFAVFRLAHWGPLHWLPDGIVSAAFVGLLLTVIRQWRAPPRRGA